MKDFDIPGYNGWTNWETWQFMLSATNDEASYNAMLELVQSEVDRTGTVCEIAAFKIGRAIFPDGTPDHAGFNGIDWADIADSMLDSVRG